MWPLTPVEAKLLCPGRVTLLYEDHSSIGHASGNVKIIQFDPLLTLRTDVIGHLIRHLSKEIRYKLSQTNLQYVNQTSKLLSKLTLIITISQTRFIYFIKISLFKTNMMRLRITITL